MSKIDFNRIDLGQALRKLAPVAKQGVLYFEALTGGERIKIAAHNSDKWPTMSMVHYVPAIFDDFKPFCINARRFRRFCIAVNDDVSLRIGKRLSVVSGANRTQLALANAKVFPKLFTPANLVCRLSHAVARNVLSVSSIPDPEDYMPLKSSVYLMIDNEYIRALATDGFRAGYVYEKNESETTLNALVSAEALQLLQESYWTDKLSLFFNDNKVFFVADDFYVYVPLVHMEGDYPAEQIITQLTDELDASVTVNPKDLADKLIACATMAVSSKYIPIKFTMINGQLLIQTRDNEAGVMEFSVRAIKQTGRDGTEFWVNSVYLRHAIGLTEQISEDGLDNITIGNGATTNWVFVGKPGLNARYAFGKMHIDAWEKSQ